MKSWLLLALVGAADSALVVVVNGIPADQLTKRVVQGKHDKQAKPWEPSTPASHAGPAPHSPDLVSTKEHGDDVPEAIRKLEANDNAV